jgi:hypothetical protein
LDQRNYTFRAISKSRNINAKPPPFKTNEKGGYQSSSTAPGFIKINMTLAHLPERQEQEFIRI